LQEERKRCGLSQAAFGDVGGVQKRAQINYENGERSPDADYLSRIAGFGVDVLYVLTGRRAPAGGLVAMEPGPGGPLSLQEQGLLKGFRQLDAKGRQAVLKMQEALAHAAPGQAVSGRVENAAGPAWPQVMEWVMDALRSRGTPMPSG
jgi:transcriptional regulator with XRE-family HTH domain